MEDYEKRTAGREKCHKEFKEYLDAQLKWAESMYLKYNDPHMLTMMVKMLKDALEMRDEHLKSVKESEKFQYNLARDYREFADDYKKSLEAANEHIKEQQQRNESMRDSLLERVKYYREVAEKLRSKS